MARIIAIANQKGGVGKTTTAVNLGACLAVAEKRTLIVDMDPQGNATSGLGIKRGEVEQSAYDVLVEGVDVPAATRREIHFPYLDLVPSTRDLVGAEVELVNQPARELVLRAAPWSRCATTMITCWWIVRLPWACSHSTPWRRRTRY
jgi:chromosome partitioning protein